jgi:hypothetical protein
MKTSIQDSIKVYWESKTNESLAQLKRVLEAELTPLEYAELAVKTEGSVEPVPRRLQRIKTARLLHACMGMCTGVAELYQNIAKASFDTVNFREELGDALWYAAVICNILETPIQDLLANPADLQINQSTVYLSDNTIVELTAKLNEATIAVGEIQDVVRRHVFYGRLLDINRLTPNLGIYVRCLQQIGAELGIEFKDMAITNLTKLIVLFGNCFVEGAPQESNTNLTRPLA